MIRRKPLSSRTGSRRRPVPLVEVELDDLVGFSIGGVGHLDGDGDGPVGGGGRLIDGEVGVLEAAVAQAVPEGEQRRAVFVPVAAPLVLGVVRPGVRVDHRHLADGSRPGEGELAAGRDIAEEQVRDGLAAAAAGVPDVEDRRHVLGGPAQVERPTVHDQQHDRRPRGDDGLQQFELAARELQR